MRPLEKRLGDILLLASMAVLAVIAFWYPWYVCKYYSSQDDRYGFVLICALPFWFIGPGVTLLVSIRLFSNLLRGGRAAQNKMYAASGAVLAALGFSPLVMCQRSVKVYHQGTK